MTLFQPGRAALPRRHDIGAAQALRKTSGAVDSYTKRCQVDGVCDFFKRATEEAGPKC